MAFGTIRVLWKALGVGLRSAPGRPRVTLVELAVLPESADRCIYLHGAEYLEHPVQAPVLTDWRCRLEKPRALVDHGKD